MRSLHSIYNSSFGQVIRGAFDVDAISGNDFDGVHSHLSRWLARNDMLLFATHSNFDSEDILRKVNNYAFKFNLIFFS
jgi:hypothetical protein